MKNNQVKEMTHQPNRPLSIERDWNFGNEKIIIEGVTYDAEYFRTLAHPDPNMLYSVRRDGDQVILKSISYVEEARKFFMEIGGM